MLKNCKNETEWDSLTDEDYISFSKYGDQNNSIIGIIFRCPGCSKLISINEGWELDLKTMTATPSILHDKKKVDAVGMVGLKMENLRYERRAIYRQKRKVNICKYFRCKVFSRTIYF